jgi:hypothetical protein
MKKLKFLLAVAMVAVSGAAMAEMIQPLQNGAQVYNPATGHYEYGCGAYYFTAYSPSYYREQMPAMLEGQSTTVYSGGSITISCSSGTLYAWADAWQGDLTN